VEQVRDTRATTTTTTRISIIQPSIIIGAAAAARTQPVHSARRRFYLFYRRRTRRDDAMTRSEDTCDEFNRLTDATMNDVRRANRGEGLGKNRHGRVDALEVTKREENAGLGKTKERYAWDEKWWEGHYANAAHKFAAAVGASGGAGAGASDAESSDSSDSEEDALMVKLGTVTGRDGVAYSGSKSDLKLMEELAKDNHRGSTFGGRVGKLERIAKFEAEQLAKYGIQSGSAVKAIETKTTPNERGAAKEKKKKKEKKKDKKQEKKSKSADESEPESEPAAAYEGEKSASTKERDWWFRAGFSWGGLVGSKREKDLTTDADGRPSKPRSGFTEDDQEALFKSAHERGVQKGTKRGLGGAGIIKSEWTGDRKTFAEEDEEEEKAPKKRAKKEKKDKKDKKKKKDKK
jgi:Pin2-interacting protein X1